MRDRIPGAPGQYTAVVDQAQLQKLQNAEQFTITLRRDDQPLVEGTPYSKAAVLPDAVAAKLCPQVDDPTPADAFETIAQHIHIQNNPHAVTAAQVGALPVNGGTMKGAINMGSKKITNLATPTANSDAAHKKYVDGKVGEAVIISQGRSGDWYYRKWSDGFAECWRSIAGMTNVDYAWGGVYSSVLAANILANYPFEFNTKPTVQFTPECAASGNYWVATKAEGTVKTTPNIQIVSGAARNDAKYMIYVYAFGESTT